MRREGVRLQLRKHVQEVVVSFRNLSEQIGVGRGSGGGGGEGTSQDREGGGGGGRGGGGRGEGGRGGGGGERQVEVQRGEANVSTPVDQLMQGLWRCSQGNPSSSWK